MTRALDMLASIPRAEWIDLGYMVMVPTLTVIVAPFVVLWFRP